MSVRPPNHAGRDLFGSRISVMTGDRENSKSQHHQRNMSVPTVPGSGLIVIQAEFVLGGLEGVLNRSAVPFNRDKDFDWGCRRGTKC